MAIKFSTGTISDQHSSPTDNKTILSGRLTPPPNKDWYVDTPQERALNMLAMRLRLRHGEMFKFKHISAHVDNEVAVVFILDNQNKSVILEDDTDLFPSDKLITQLRLMMG